MGLGNFFKSMFGGQSDGGATKAADPVEYNGYHIVAEPVKEGGQYRTAGTISKDIDGTRREVRFIRADNTSDYQSAVDHCVNKGKQIINERGDAMFEREMV